MKLFIAGGLILFLVACVPLGKSGVNPDRTQDLVIATFPENQELGRYPLGLDQGFSLSFIHSVSKTPVIDVYEIRKFQIIQTMEKFKAHGAGLPSSPDEPGGISWEKDGDWFVLNMERPIPKLVIRTDRLYRNRLSLASGTINLNQWVDQALIITIDPGASF